MAQSAEGADVCELAGAAYVYLSRFVDPEAALVDGFDVLAWCDEFDRLRTIGPLEGGEAGAARAVPHGASPSSSGPPPSSHMGRPAPLGWEALTQQEAEQDARGSAYADPWLREAPVDPRRRENFLMDDLDRVELLMLFEKRLTTMSEPMRRYWEGRIDGHCLQNAIEEAELVALATANGYRVDWETAMGVVRAERNGAASLTDLRVQKARAWLPLGATEARAALDEIIRERDQARDALRRIQAEELNGRLCPRPECPEDRCCDNCRKTWALVDAALLAGGETVNQKPKGHTA